MENEVYDAVWKSFITGDHISQGSIWGGAGLALVLPIVEPVVLSRIDQLQKRLAAQLPFAAHLPEMLHLTIDLLGNPPAEQTSTLSEIMCKALAPVRAFPLSLNRVNSFFRAPFLEVDEIGALNTLHSNTRPALTRMSIPEIDYGPRGQVWHVTLGAYTEAGDGVIARKLLSELRLISAGTFWVNELRLVKTSAGAPYRMETLYRFPLQNPQSGFTLNGKSESYEQRSNQSDTPNV